MSESLKQMLSEMSQDGLLQVIEIISDREDVKNVSLEFKPKAIQEKEVKNEQASC